MGLGKPVLDIFHLTVGTTFVTVTCIDRQQAGVEVSCCKPDKSV